MYLDILNFIAAAGAVLSGSRICNARIQKKALSESRVSVAVFILCLILLWFINIYTGFIQ